MAITPLSLLKKVSASSHTQKLDETNEKLESKVFELHLAMNYLTRLLNHMDQGILFISGEGIITTYNAAAERLIGKAPASVLFNPFWDSFPDNLFGFSLRESLDQGQAPARKVIAFKERTLEVTSSFIQETEDRDLQSFDFSRGIIILIRDVTELRRLEQIAARTDRMKELGQMAAIVAHEIRNPLGGIKGFASLLVRDLQDRPPLQEMARSIVEGTDNLNRLVSDILNYSRPLQLQLEEIDLRALAQEVLQHVAMDNSFDKRIAFTVEEGSPLKLAVDSYLIKSVLLNLILNAAQAMVDGSSSQGGSIQIAIAKNNEEAQLEVHDTGSGIPPENIEKIFSPFFTTKSTGFGFGLAEVHRIVEAHEGTIEVHSEVGKGSQFIIKLPLRRIL
jgi:signal transduction histidine kinase